MASGPSIDALLAEWWGGSFQNYVWCAGVTNAANIVFGSNPPYTLSDFLATYPQFGTGVQAILTAQIRNGGTGYSVGDILTVVQPGGKLGTLVVSGTTVPGVITDLTPPASPGVGTGYQVANGLPTTSNSVDGTGATIDVLTISPFVVPTGLSVAIMQLYLNLATVTLSALRWDAWWVPAVGWFVAHFLTLYLQSQGAVGGTAQQIAASGLAKGLNVSKSAGDVSLGTEYLLQGWEDWGSFNLTIFGQQLITIADIVGMGPMYIY